MRLLYFCTSHQFYEWVSSLTRVAVKLQLCFKSDERCGGYVTVESPLTPSSINHAESEFYFAKPDTGDLKGHFKV